jgi:hypothetical protein
MPGRRRFKQIRPLQDRLAAWADDVREQAARRPPGPERDAIYTRLRQADTAAHFVDAWTSSSGRDPRE